MKRHYWLIIAIIVIAGTISALFFSKLKITDLPSNLNNTREFSGGIVSFSYSESNGWTYSNNYSLTKEDDEMFFTKQSRGKLDNRKIKINESVFQKLEKIIDKNGIKSRNGFNKRAEGVYDGSSRDINITYLNGDTISAQGYMFYPEGFHEKIGIITEYLNSLSGEDTGNCI